MPTRNGVVMPKAPPPRPEKVREATDRDRLRALAKSLWPDALASWRAARHHEAFWAARGLCGCGSCAEPRVGQCPQCHGIFFRHRPEQRWCSKRCASVPKGQRRKGQTRRASTRKEQS